MRHKLLVTGAAGLIAVGLGAGIGVAAAQIDGSSRPDRNAIESMDQMHSVMSEDMPDDLVAECDAAHAAMSDSMHDGRFGMPGPASIDHTAHHS
ncbi:MAG: hypothetical protein JJE52_02905 [Acidimicrobiia bacterium]|nr:hypothetical protein [Acidimicrobiia bacterium]